MGEHSAATGTAPPSGNDHRSYGMGMAAVAAVAVGSGAVVAGGVAGIAAAGWPPAAALGLIAAVAAAQYLTLARWERRRGRARR